jgi:hypothetical protein
MDVLYVKWSVECVKKVQPASKRKQGTNIVTSLASQAGNTACTVSTTHKHNITRLNRATHTPLTATPRHIISYRKSPAEYSAALI